MIPVKPQPEPPSFDANVRQPGRRAIQELIGQPPISKRRGPKRKKQADRVEDLKSKDLPPFWTHCLDDLHASYDGICAYLRLYIEKVMGAGTVDHFVAKVGAVEDAYEWKNYRLCVCRHEQPQGPVF